MNYKIRPRHHTSGLPPVCRTTASAALEDRQIPVNNLTSTLSNAQCTPSGHIDGSNLREIPCIVMYALNFVRTTTVLADGRTLCLAPAPNGVKVKLDQGRQRESRKELQMTFDRVLGESAEQKEVYDQVKACVRLPFSGEDNSRLSNIRQTFPRGRS